MMALPHREAHIENSVHETEKIFGPFYSIVLHAMRVNDPLAKLRSGVSTLCYLTFVTTNMRSELG